MNRLFKEYRIEIIALLAGLSGVFLLVEKMDIRATLWRLFTETLAAIRAAGESVLLWTEDTITHFTLSDMIGFLIVLLALAFIFWRIRYRFMNSKRWLDTACPRCQAPLVRIHRTRLDRWLGLSLLPHSRRYSCSNAKCGWSGLRYHHQRRHFEAESSFDQEATLS